MLRGFTKMGDDVSCPMFHVRILFARIRRTIARIFAMEPRDAELSPRRLRLPELRNLSHVSPMSEQPPSPSRERFIKDRRTKDRLRKAAKRSNSRTSVVTSDPGIDGAGTQQPVINDRLKMTASERRARDRIRKGKQRESNVPAKSSAERREERLVRAVNRRREKRAAAREDLESSTQDLNLDLNDRHDRGLHGLGIEDSTDSSSSHGSSSPYGSESGRDDVAGCSQWQGLPPRRATRGSDSDDAHSNHGEHGSSVRAEPAVSHVTLSLDKSGRGTCFSDLPFQLLDLSSLRVALMSHSVERSSVRSEDALRALAIGHSCTAVCRSVTFQITHAFQELQEDSADACRIFLDRLMQEKVIPNFPMKMTDSRRNDIITRWLDRLSDEQFDEVTCAVCSELVNATLSSVRQLDDAHLQLLVNPGLPAGVFPSGYDRALYCDAVLDARGFVPEEGPRAMHVCNSCWSSVSRHKLPSLSLANDHYRGSNCVPPDIMRLFLSATPIELSLISRMRAKCTVYKFSKKANTPQFGTSDFTSQQYSKGNVITFANGNTKLLSMLPPSPDEFRECVSVIFVGNVMPGPEEIEKLKPLLVRRHVITSLINWLRLNNPFYSDVRLSQENLDALLPNKQSGVPATIDIQLVRSQATDVPSSGYVPTEPSKASAGAELPLASDGVIGQSFEDTTIKELKLRAMQHWKNGGAAYAIPHGNEPIKEWNNPAHFPCMYPHLFPWGIGGIEDPKRRKKTSMEAHVRHLLNDSDRTFQVDRSFMYIAMNVIQKRVVWHTSRFKVKRSRCQNACDFLSSAEVSACATLRARAKQNGGQVTAENDDEQTVLNMVRDIKMMPTLLPGSESSKTSMRNEIRSLCNFLGMPTFFFTLNPSDTHHPLFAKLAGARVSLNERVPADLPSDHERDVLVHRRDVPILRPRRWRTLGT